MALQIPSTDFYHAPVDVYGGLNTTLNQWNAQADQAKREAPLRQQQLAAAQSQQIQNANDLRMQGYIAKADAATDPQEKLNLYAQAHPDVAMQLHGKTIEQQIGLLDTYAAQAAAMGDGNAFMTALKTKKALVDSGDVFSYNPNKNPQAPQAPATQAPSAQAPSAQAPSAQAPSAQAPTNNPYGLPDIAIQKKVANTVKVYDKTGVEHKLGLDTFGNPIKLDTTGLPTDFNYKDYSEVPPSKTELKFVDPRTKDSYVLTYDKAYPNAPRVWLKGGRPVDEKSVPSTIRSEVVGNAEAKITILDPWNRAAANSWGNTQTNANKMQQEGKTVGSYSTPSGRKIQVSNGGTAPTSNNSTAKVDPNAPLNLPPFQAQIYDKVDAKLNKATAPLKDANFQIDRLNEILTQNNPATVGNVALDKARLFSGTLASTRVQMSKYLATAEAGDRSMYQRGVQALETMKSGKLSQANISEVNAAVADLKKVYAKYTRSTVDGIANNAINIPEVAKARLKNQYYSMVSGGATSTSVGSTKSKYSDVSTDDLLKSLGQ